MKPLHTLFTGALVGFVIGLVFLFNTSPAEVQAAPEPVKYPIWLYAEPTPIPRIVPRFIDNTTDTVTANHVFTPSDAPTYWRTCSEMNVYGGPGVNPDWFLYSIPDDTDVMVRELDNTRTWAMIKPAQWVDFSELCEAE